MNGADHERPPWHKIAAGGVILAVAVAAYAWLWQAGMLEVLRDEKALTAAVRGLGPWGPIGTVALMATAIVISPLPSAPIAIAAGMVFGVVWGAVITVIGAVLGAVVAFLIARWLGYEAVRRWSGADRMLRFLAQERSQLWLMAVVFASRLLPFVSFDAVSYAAGLTPLKFWRFAVATAVGVIPVSVALTYAGEELSTAGLAIISLVLIVAVALPLVPATVRTLRQVLGNRPAPCDVGRPAQYRGVMAHLSEPTTGRAAAPMLRLAEFDAGVFDLDGVVTRTADVHRAAWKVLFDGFLASRGTDFAPFTDEDYYRYVDGLPRYEGVRTFLASRGITLAYGDPSDPPEAETVCGLGNRKNEAFNRTLEKDGVAVFESSVALIKAVRQHGCRTAIVSSSANAGAVLAAAGLEDLFDTVVDGREAARLGLKGKPDPDTYRHALEVLGVEPGRAFGVEDAISGVESIRAAGYRLVVGVDRADQRQALLSHGADIVVGDLGELQPAPPDAVSSADLADALESFDALAERWRDKTPAVFLDYDGTLTPIVSRPDLAVLDDDMRAVLAEAAEVFPTAIISGRDRANVEALVKLPGLIFAGSHGFDIAGPGGLKREYEAAAKFIPALDEAEARLNAAIGGIEGVLIERKRYAIAVHFRLVAENELGAVEDGFEAVLAKSGELRKTLGKKIFELRPKLDWDKGRAVLWLLGELGLDRPDVVPIYVGDDHTDEDAFAALAGRGIGILVADEPQPTRASYRLNEPHDVGVFLRRLIARYRENPPQ